MFSSHAGFRYRTLAAMRSCQQGTPMNYRGRFAPSPTGDLHFGSLVTATASYLDARANNGQWLLRIEDVDKGRTVPGAADQILHTLEAFGFAWDGPVWMQSQRDAAYLAALEQLAARGLLYPCQCSRSQIAAAAVHSLTDGSLLYPGTCRPVKGSMHVLTEFAPSAAWRLRVDDQRVICFDDLLQGTFCEQLGLEVGDFVLRRADGLFAYQLAVVVDDAEQGVNAVVRGADLLGSTARQMYLQQCLGYPQPVYAHLPLATDAYGKKWSKKRLAPALQPAEAGLLLWHALRFLGQPVPDELAGAAPGELWSWALQHWALAQVPHCITLRTPAALI